MQLVFPRRIAVLVLSIGVCVLGQNPPGREAATEAKGIPPRATPADYEAHAQAGNVTLAAEFTGHSLPTAEGPLTSEDYVGVETALFGPPGAQLKISASDFSLNVNGRKTPLPSQPFVVMMRSLRDPEWVPPDQPASKSKSSIGGSGQERESSGPPPPVKIPESLQRAMVQRLRKASLPEGDRPLPQAGLIFFQYRGNKNLDAVELIYDGPAGKATLKLTQ